MRNALTEKSCAPRGHFTSKSAWWFSRKNLSMPSAAAAEHCSPASQEGAASVQLPDMTLHTRTQVLWGPSTGSAKV